jgi:hypothetical protein
VATSARLSSPAYAFGQNALKDTKVRRGDLDRVEGKFEEVDPAQVGDVAER